MPTIRSKKAAMKLMRITTMMTGRMPTTKLTRSGMIATMPVRTSETGVRLIDVSVTPR